MHACAAWSATLSLRPRTVFDPRFILSMRSPLQSCATMDVENYQQALIAQGFRAYRPSYGTHSYLHVSWYGKPS
jgi:hypothetical protein